MAFIKFVLSKARQLEVFNIHVYRRLLEFDEKVAEVALYTRASPAANVLFRRMP
jgi:hypothetical protein